MKQQFYRRFIISLLCLIPFLVLAIVIFNFLVDPFDLHRSPSLKGFNKIKTEIEKQARLYKAMEIARQKPKAILLGSSRVMAGFDPNDLSALTDEYAYNAGVSGANFEEICRLFEHALYHQPDLKVVVLGIDLFSFSENKKLEKELAPERLCSFPSLLWNDVYASLLTKEAFIASYQTVKKNLCQTASPVFLTHGQLYIPGLTSGHTGFQLAKSDIDLIKRMFSSSDLYRCYRLDRKKIELFRQLVQSCKEHSIRLEVIINPSKAMYWEALYRGELWPYLEELKRHLSAIHPIWDFSGFNCITTQAIEKEAEPFYFECSHFTPFLGKLILNKIFNKPPFPSDFGDLLNSQTIDQVLSLIRSQRAQWVEQHPEIIIEIEQAFTHLY